MNFGVPQNLTPIYEEFDFSSIKKDLENKKIKVKRIIKHKESSQVPGLITSSTVSNQTGGDTTLQELNLNPSYPPQHRLLKKDVELNSIEKNSQTTSSFFDFHKLDNSIIIPAESFAAQNLPTQEPTIGVSTQNRHTPPTIARDENNEVPEREGRYIASSTYGHHYSKPRSVPPRKAMNNLFHSSQITFRERENAFKEPQNSNSEISLQHPQNPVLNNLSTGIPKTTLGALTSSNFYNKPIRFAEGSNQDADHQSRSRSHAKKTNPMYWSQSTKVIHSKGSAQTNGQNDEKAKDNLLFEEFMLPKQVMKLLRDQEKNIETVKMKLEREKSKLDAELDSVMQEVFVAFQEKKKQIHNVFDSYYANYKKNYEVLKGKVSQFKSCIGLDSTKGSSNDCHISSLAYLLKTQEDWTRIREENVNLNWKIGNVGREVNKKLITFFAEELDKQSIHCPLFNHSESSNSLARELRTNLKNFVAENLSSYSDLIYNSLHLDFSNVTLKPHIDTGVKRNCQNVICNMKEKSFNKLMTLSLVQKFSTTHLAPITCLKALPDDTIVTGAKDGTIKVWDIKNLKQKASMKGHLQEITFLDLCTLRPSCLMNHKSTLLKGSSQNETQQIYLISGGGNGDCVIRLWDISTWTEVRLFSDGHTAGITGALVIIRETESILVSSGLDGALTIWDLRSGNMTQRSHPHGHMPITSMIPQSCETILTCGLDSRIVRHIIHENHSGCSVTSEVKVPENKGVNKLAISSIDGNLVIGGCADGKIRIWNFSSAIPELEREIVSLQSPAIDLLLFESPLDFNKGARNMAILAVGENDEVLRMSNYGTTSLSFPLFLDGTFSLSYTQSIHPIIQVTKSTQADSVNLILAHQGSSEKCFSIWRLYF